MKANFLFPIFLLSILAVSGCKTYDYRVVEPANLAQRITKQPVTLHYDPLEYRMARSGGFLAMNIVNPTDDRIVLRGNRSYVIDPQGETHPIRDRVIGPHSFTRMSVPPVPLRYQTMGPYWGWGVGMGYPFSPFYGAFYNDFYYGPDYINYEVTTQYDWEWKTGPARLRLAYDRDGKSFDHNFVIIREPAK
ncbi:MAG: hypothetical protein JWQ71_2665 [Pedosphaera sp.]|nr:hypothetical protein [Pedosphaera sp.]